MICQFRHYPWWPDQPVRLFSQCPGHQHDLMQNEGGIAILSSSRIPVTAFTWNPAWTFRSVLSEPFSRQTQMYSYHSSQINAPVTAMICIVINVVTALLPMASFIALPPERAMNVQALRRRRSADLCIRFTASVLLVFPFMTALTFCSQHPGSALYSPSCALRWKKKLAERNEYITHVTTRNE